MAQELITFQRSVKQGVKQFDKITKSADELTGQQIFNLRSSFGMPLDLITELAKERDIRVDIEGYKLEFLKHQQISRNLGKK